MCEREREIETKKDYVVKSNSPRQVRVALVALVSDSSGSSGSSGSGSSSSRCILGATHDGDENVGDVDTVKEPQGGAEATRHGDGLVWCGVVVCQC